MNAAFVVVNAGFVPMNAAWMLTIAAFVVAIAAGFDARREGSLLAKLPSAAEAEFSPQSSMARLKPCPFKAPNLFAGDESSQAATARFSKSQYGTGLGRVEQGTGYGLRGRWSQIADQETGDLCPVKHESSVRDGGQSFSCS
jgi:hypothetical protein